MLSSILVRDVMSRNVKTARPDSKLREVIQKMVKFNISSVIIMERENPVGVITERDILKNLASGPLDIDIIEAKKIMSGPLITTVEDEDLEQASRMMLEKNIKKLPVVRDGNLVGILTSSDIVRGTGLLTRTFKDLSMMGRETDRH